MKFKVQLLNAGKFQVSGTSLRGAKGFAYLNVLMDNHERRILAQKRRYIKRAAYYLRKVARSLIKRGSTKVERLPNRQVNTKTGKFETGVLKTKKRTRSTSPNSPFTHGSSSGGKMGMKSLWAEPYKGDPDAYIIAPLVFRSKGSSKVDFKIHAKLSKGGTGKVYMPVNDNASLTSHQKYTKGMKKAEWRWVPARYPKRPYMKNAIAPTRKKFASLWYSSKSK